MAREFYQPPKLGKQRDQEENGYDEPLIPTSPKIETPASDQAQKTLDDIDSVLNDNAKPEPSGGSDDDNKGAKPETKGGDSGNDGGKSLFKEDEKKKKKGLRPANNRGIYLILGGLASVVIPIALFIFFLLGALELPNFVSDMTNYEFARVTRNIATADTTLTTEKMALASQDDSTLTKITNKFYKAKNIIGEMGKFNLQNAIAYAFSGTIAKTIAPMQLGFAKETSGLFRTVLTTVSMKDPTTGVVTEYTLKQGGFLGRVVPGLNFARQVSFARDFVPDLQASLRVGTDSGAKSFLARGLATTFVRQGLNINRVAWKTGQYTGDTDEKADTEVAKDTLAKVDQSKPVPAETGSVENGTNAADEQLQELKTGTGQQEAAAVKDAVINGGFSPKMQNLVNKAISGSLTGVVNVISPTYQLATTVCLVYDDSLNNPNSAGLIDGQDQNLQRTGFLTDAAGDETKSPPTGDPDGSARAARAWNNKVAGTAYNMTPSTYNNTVYQAANGQQRDTSQFPSPQSTPSGEYTIFNFLFSGSAGSFFNSVANAICPAATNLGVGMALGGITLLSCFTPAAPDCLGAKAAEDGAKTVAGRILGKIVTKIANEKAGSITSALGGVLTDGVKNLIKVGGTTVALTYIAKALVYTHSFAATSGIQTGPDFAAQADEGNNLTANQESQQSYYGRPLTSTDLAKSQAADNHYLQSLNRSQSTFDRYFALSNAQSLVSRLAISAHATFNASFFRNFANLSAKVLSPIGSLGQVLSFWQHNKVSAAASSVNDDTNYYGIVQWGFSEDEDALIQNDPTYGPVENEQILNNSNQSDAIQAKYGECFTATMGTLLSKGEIVRDDNGNVIANQGLCAPDNLSYNSPDPVAYDGDSGSSHQRDLIFRYRLEKDYQQGLADLTAQGAGATTS